MLIALAAELFKNGDVKFNSDMILKKIMLASSENVSLICFGEAFLQGFDGLTWDHEKDSEIALTANDPVIEKIKLAAAQSSVAVSFGYIERSAEVFYSSNIFISDSGKILNNFRRLSPGWKVPYADNLYYKEGKDFSLFEYMGKKMATAICGDLWYDDILAKAQSLCADVFLWPLYVSYSVNDWEGGIKQEYAQRVAGIDAPVLMINSFLPEKDGAMGGCCVFRDGRVERELKMGDRGLLIFEV
ncbi:MAG: carbon-nitrogen hydrolase family protein [Petrotogaceae bacterium]|jgi:N-carbamoylputrescine amidase|nr:carbon-nitrogen hydrolase family protein [Petrotogaceae bacterium]